MLQGKQIIWNSIKLHFSYLNSCWHVSEHNIVKPLKLQNILGKAMPMVVFYPAGNVLSSQLHWTQLHTALVSMWEQGPSIYYPVYFCRILKHMRLIWPLVTTDLGIVSSNRTGLWFNSLNSSTPMFHCCSSWMQWSLAELPAFSNWSISPGELLKMAPSQTDNRVWFMSDTALCKCGIITNKTVCAFWVNQLWSSIDCLNFFKKLNKTRTDFFVTLKSFNNRQLMGSWVTWSSEAGVWN